ncbi:MAG: hypothetical protein CVU95_07840 [Firmicutes bacterium HGW-Firmicutes-2]|jgi:hypothetical protein|nr:MAG: hypothetical protein CVU95_07840 [Firmicutes bacterium HGW-Firmicutes-2]
MEEEKHFIAFRGIDSTLTGWIENFYMSFIDEGWLKSNPFQ